MEQSDVKCPKCSEPLEKKCKFCPECGGKLDVSLWEEKPSTYKCGECGEECPINAKFCSECGLKSKSPLI